MSSSDDEEYDIETILKSRKTKRKYVFSMPTSNFVQKDLN